MKQEIKKFELLTLNNLQTLLQLLISSGMEIVTVIGGSGEVKNDYIIVYNNPTGVKHGVAMFNLNTQTQ